jgi:hypothetical protein
MGAGLCSESAYFAQTWALSSKNQHTLLKNLHILLNIDVVCVDFSVFIFMTEFNRENTR